MFPIIVKPFCCCWACPKRRAIPWGDVVKAQASGRGRAAESGVWPLGIVECDPCADDAHNYKSIDRLALPRTHLILMNLMSRRDLLHRLVAPRGLQRYPRLELPVNRLRVLIANPSVTRRNKP